MGQIEVMQFLDKHPGEYFTGKEISIHLNIKDKVIFRNMNKIIKRHEYCCFLKEQINSKKIIAVYGRRVENGRTKTN